MTPENHIFISYAPVDDEDAPGSDGWVTRFHQYLESYLNMSMGSEAKIQRGDKSNANGQIAEEIASQLSNTGALISVISDRYVESPLCISEADTFCDVAQKNKPGLQIQNKTRLFKVNLNPIGEDQWSQLPGPMKDLLGYEFFEEVGNRTILLDPERSEQPYKQKIFLLAQDIADTLKLMENSNGVSGSSAVADTHAGGESEIGTGQEKDKLVVYLAECGADQSKERSTLYGTLRNKYTILPDTNLFHVENAYKETVQDMLSRCDLSIHLVGQGNGGTLEGPGQISPVQLQHELALVNSAQRGMKRLIWMPDGVIGNTPSHQDFLDSLGTESRHLLNGDLIAGSYKDLELEVLNTLEVLAEEKKKVSAAAPSDPGKLSVYVICVEDDFVHPDFRKLMRYFTEQDIDIVWPEFDGEPDKVQRASEDGIKNSDIILLYFGAGDMAWKESQESELKRVLGMRTKKHVLANYVYLGGEKTMDKLKLSMKSSSALDGLSGFSPDVMKPLMDAVQNNK